MDPGSKRSATRSCSWPHVETVECPAGQHKRGPLGPQFVAEEGSSDNCVGPGIMYNYVHKEQHSKERVHINYICTIQS